PSHCYPHHPHLHSFPTRRSSDLYVQIQKDDQALHIDVFDNGEGIPEKRLALLGKQTVESEKGTGTALENLARRIQTLYDNQGNLDRKSTRLNSSHVSISYAVFCL